MAKLTRRRAVGWIAATCAAGLLVLSAPMWGGYLGRRIAWFDVARVEISGASLVPPHEVLRTSGIREGHSVMDAHEPWERALRQHPVIADARVSVRLPNTLRVRIVEERPVAFVGEARLDPVTATGAVLPLDPGAARLDLPVVVGSIDDPEQAPAVRRAVAETGRLEALAPDLMAVVSEVRAEGDGETVLHLTHPAGELILPVGADQTRIGELRSVLADLARRLPPESRVQVDLRFEDQIVVRHSSPRELS